MRINKLLVLFALAALVVASSSCVTSKKVRYLQDMPKQGMPINDNLEATVAPYDELRIYVLSNTGKDDELIKPFNIMGGASTQGGISNQGSGYLVDVNGDIQFPILGKLHVRGMTRIQLQETIANRLIEGGYMNEPMVDVRFINFRIFVLGTADGGKVLNIENERCTFLEALAMAGGLNKFSKRDKIAVMREENGKIVTHFLDPRSTDVFYDPYFLLQQNDIIITQSFRRLYAQDVLNSSLNALTAVSSLVSTIVLIYLAVEGN